MRNHRGGITADVPTTLSAVKVYTQSELEGMTKSEIASLAEELGYDGVTTDLNKNAMVEAFLAAQL